jgi:HEAT repeat protein
MLNCIVLLCAFTLKVAQPSHSFLLNNDEQKQISVLQSDAPLFDKVTACRKLAFIGTKAAVPALTELLCDEKLGDYARIALERIDDPGVDEHLREALSKCRGRALIGVVNSIAVRQDTRAIPALTKLATNPSSGAAAHALAALGQMGSDEAIEPILEVLNTGPEPLQSAAAKACLRSAEYLIDQTKKQDALNLYKAIRKADVPVHLRAAATFHMILAGGPDGLPLLVEQLKSDEPEMVAVSLRAAREIPRDQVSTKLTDKMTQFDPDVQTRVVRAIADRRDPNTLQSVKQLAKSDIPEVYLESLRAMGKVGDASTVPILLKAAHAGGEQSRIASSSLRTIKGANVDKAITNNLKTIEDADIIVTLLDVLSDRDATLAVDAIFKKAHSKNNRVRKTAFSALGRLADPGHLNRMIHFVDDLKGNTGRKDLERAIVLVSGKIPDESIQADEVIKAFEKQEDIATRCSFIRILGDIANERAFQTILPLLNNPNDQIKDAAVRALADWPDTRALKPLLAILNNTGNEIHRVLALRGTVRLLMQDTEIPQHEKVRIYTELLEKSETPTAQKNILSGLARVKHSSALTIAAKYIDDPQVDDEACLAVIQIVKAIADTEPNQAETALLKVTEKTSNGKINHQARDLLKKIRKSEDDK